MARMLYGYRTKNRKIIFNLKFKSQYKPKGTKIECVLK